MDKTLEKLLSLCDTWLDTDKDLCISEEDFDVLKSDLEKMSNGEFKESIFYRRFGSIYLDCKKEFNNKAFKEKLKEVAKYRLKNLGKWEN